jgi:hypothetical protein
MNWKIRSRGGRQAVPTEGETDVHRPYSLPRGPIIVNSTVVTVYHFAIRA